MAFDLLKTSAKSWYSEGTLERSGIGALEPAELAQSLIPSEWSWRVNCTEPSSLHACIYTAAETREMGEQFLVTMEVPQKWSEGTEELEVAQPAWKMRQEAWAQEGLANSAHLNGR